jgi:hypothetical protein
MEQGIREPWVLARHRWGRGLECEVLDGADMRQLLERALELTESTLERR